MNPGKNYMFSGKTMHLLGALLCFALVGIEPIQAFDFKGLHNLVGTRDAVIVSGPDHRVLFLHNADALMVPASTLKLLTALTAFHTLGENYHFRTEFFLDPDSNLKIKGYGDPLLISEVIADIAASVYELLKDTSPSLSNIIVDSTYFDSSVVIPGVTDTTEPYDSPNGALCVNFNTVNFETFHGSYISAEPQTPLLPMTLDRIKKTGLSRGRITLSHQKDELVLYAGRLFKHFLQRAGVMVTGKVLLGKVETTDKRLLRYASPYPLNQVVAKMMTYSNNFMANQILLESGIALAGPPGNLQKGIAAVREYARNELGVVGFRISEGSGISRANRVTARDLHRILLKFKPHYRLLRQEGTDFYKTGTLKNISTRVGFMGQDETTLYAYVILCNTPGHSATRVRNRLLEILGQ
jgi:D-alanyl-D-alanine carboxypeptidase/D-alanyl-D-alanine-endopeptidase (penicillin-binding protein 4)